MYQHCLHIQRKRVLKNRQVDGSGACYPAMDTAKVLKVGQEFLCHFRHFSPEYVSYPSPSRESGCTHFPAVGAPPPPAANYFSDKKETKGTGQRIYDNLSRPELYHVPGVYCTV